MPRYKMTLSYDGTGYAGWQVQPGQKTIQLALQEALSRLTQERVGVTGCGRTDAGVHARQHVSHFDLEMPVDPDDLTYRLSRVLPGDICVHRIEEVPSDFHARYSAFGKRYRYYFSLGPIQDPFRRSAALEVPRTIDVAAMKEAACAFVGEHDFTAFAHQAHVGCAKNAPVKTIHSIEWGKEEGLVYFEIVGNGFLHKMVRNLVGTLIEVGIGKRAADSMNEILMARDRKAAGKTAPAQGLFLMEVNYLATPLVGAECNQ